MELLKSTFINSWKEITLALLMPVFFLFEENWFFYIVLLALTIVVLALYVIGEKTILFTFLILQTYHSQGLSVFTTNFLGISIIYYIIAFLILVEFYKQIKIPKFLVLFLIFLPIRFVVGFYYKYSTYNWLVETVLFLTFSAICLIVYNYKNQDRRAIIKVLKNYVLVYHPYLTLISLFFASEVDYSGKFIPFYFDEFGAFYLIAIFPILFLGIKNTLLRFGLVAFHLLFMFIKINYLYVGSFALIGAVICLMFMTIFYFKKHLKYVLVTFAILFFSAIILQNSNKFVQFKVAQVTESFKFFTNSPSLHKVKKIPNSPKIRILEFLNIQKELRQSGVLTFLFGKGFGSYFTDNNYSFKQYGVIFYDDNSAFTEKELLQRKYVRPHNTFFYMPLKIGFLGILWILISVIYAFKRANYSKWPVYAFVTYIIVFFDSGIKSFIFVGMMMAILFRHEKKNSSS